MWVRQLGRFYLVDVRALYLLVARYEISALSLLSYLSVCLSDKREGSIEYSNIAISML